MYHHLNESSSKKENKEKWKIIDNLLKNNNPPKIEILENNIENELLAFNREDFYILKYGRKGIDPNGILTNKTIGGKQPPAPNWTVERKKKHSEWNKSYWTEERKQNHNSSGSIETVSVTDQFGQSKRISKFEYDNIDKSGPMDTWKYVSVSSTESKRRKKNHLRTVTLVTLV